MYVQGKQTFAEFIIWIIHYLIATGYIIHVHTQYIVAITSRWTHYGVKILILYS